MSNLLNSGSKKKLLERGPQIAPATSFKLEDTEKATAKARVENKRANEKSVNKISSVRVRKTTRDKLNALVNINKADTIDELLEIIIEEYMAVHITKDEKKQLDIILELYRSKN